MPEFWWGLGSAMEENKQEFWACSGDGGGWTREPHPRWDLLPAARTNGPQVPGWTGGAHSTPGSWEPGTTRRMSPGEIYPTWRWARLSLHQLGNNAALGGFLTQPGSVRIMAQSLLCPLSSCRAGRPMLCRPCSIKAASGLDPSAGA